MPDTVGSTHSSDGGPDLRALAILMKTLFGGSTKGTIVVGIAAFWVGTNLVASSAYDALQGRFSWPQALILSLFGGMLLWLFIRIRRVPFGVAPARIEVLEDPPPAKVLILFLSRTKDDVSDISGDLRLAETCEQMGTRNWRMPIEAVAHHLPRLHEVWVIGSCDSPGFLGSHGQFAQFENLLGRLMPASGVRPAVKQWPTAIDFEAPAQIISSLEQLFADLAADGYQPQDIMLDVTGGQKTATAAGAAVTLKANRRFQYVSTTDHRIRSFNLTYEQL